MQLTYDTMQSPTAEPMVVDFEPGTLGEWKLHGPDHSGGYIIEGWNTEHSIRVIPTPTNAGFMVIREVAGDLGPKIDTIAQVGDDPDYMQNTLAQLLAHLTADRVPA